MKQHQRGSVQKYNNMYCAVTFVYVHKVDVMH